MILVSLAECIILPSIVLGRETLALIFCRFIITLNWEFLYYGKGMVFYWVQF